MTTDTATVTYNNTYDSVAISNWETGTSTDWYTSAGSTDYYVTWPWYYKCWHYPVVREDKFEKAFSIAKMLLKKKLLASRRLTDFIQLVEDIADCL